MNKKGEKEGEGSVRREGRWHLGMYIGRTPLVLGVELGLKKSGPCYMICNTDSCVDMFCKGL